MQITLDQLLNLIIARLDSLELRVEDLSFKTNILFRLLYENSLFDEEKLEKVVEEEINTTLAVEGEEKKITPNKAKEISKSIMRWVKSDVEELKRQMREYEEKLKQLMEEVGQIEERNIQVASPDLMKRLEEIRRKKKGNDGGLIIS